MLTKAEQQTFRCSAGRVKKATLRLADMLRCDYYYDFCWINKTKK
jgi:hypothetical protein